MASLEAICAAITAEMAALDGVALAPEMPPEQANIFPAVFVYPLTGFWRLGSSDGGSGNPTRWGVHTIAIAVHIKRTVLEMDVEALLPFTDSVPAALFAAFASDRLDGLIVGMGDASQARGGMQPVRYAWNEATWNTQPTLALTVEVDVTIEEEIT